ncbi:MAG: aminopeptidase P family protein [Acholeplasmatales bacterium]|nr:aminopeptidase P family protein [Acholeplasmatales bacterium]
MDVIELFQSAMTEKGLDAYIIPTSDYHDSEYVSEYFKGRKYLSGFTGSAGTLVITKTSAFLWADGRYYIQAEKEIEGRPIKLMKMGQPGVPTVSEFVIDYMQDKDALGFDGKVIGTKMALAIKEKLPDNVKMITDIDLINNVWPDRPALPFSLLYVLDDCFSGKPYSFKIEQLRADIANAGADTHIITVLDDIAWLLNLRGNDVEHTPVFLSFLVVKANETILFINKDKLNKDVKAYLKENKIKVKNYDDIYTYASELKDAKILIDLKRANYQLYSLIKDNNKIIDKPNPTVLKKSVKNETEIKNLREIHAKDGAAVAKLMYYVKTRYAKNLPLSEISASDYVAEQRAKIEGYVDLSFGTIAGFKDHGAMMHYSATPESNYTIKEPGFLLVDSGGHYLEGTTDITRTFGVGEITDEMKLHFTTVLKSVIALSQAVFLKGCNGQNLDILARGPIWKLLIDYKCGTGHGVGYLLSVHEAPNGFRWQIVPERNDSAKFQPGMITTNEPGIYLEDKYGIRTENEMLCINAGSNEFGEFLAFETITYCPIDLDCIDANLLSQDEKKWLNEYHAMVYKKISKYMTNMEKKWLKEYTKEI